MARNKGTFNFPSNFEVTAAEALDPRVVVSTKVELLSRDTWPNDANSVYIYAGLIVGVVDEQSVYMLLDKAKFAEADYSGWKRIDAGASVVEVINSLESDDATKPLAAAQGKVLAERIVELQNSLSSVFKYKGSKDTFAELPEDAEIGDVYNVVEANDNIPAGTNYAWNGEEWDALGGAIDLSSYATTESVNTAIDAAKSELQEAIDAVDAKADKNTSDIAKLNGADDVEGSVAKTVADAVSVLEGKHNLEIAEIKNQIEAIDSALGGADEEGKTIIEQIQEAITKIESVQGDIDKLSTVTGDVDDLKKEVFGDEATSKDGLVTTVENHTTVITEHTEHLSTLDTSVNSNTTEINKLKELVEGISDGELATVVTDVADLKTDVADLKAIDHSVYATKTEVAETYATKATLDELSQVFANATLTLEELLAQDEEATPEP